MKSNFGLLVLYCLTVFFIDMSAGCTTVNINRSAHSRANAIGDCDIAYGNIRSYKLNSLYFKGVTRASCFKDAANNESVQDSDIVMVMFKEGEPVAK